VILVTGDTGNVGAGIVRQLLDAGYAHRAAGFGSKPA
jgi:uncharacterized protein YbjT (DUF2867 family)